jgi:hypothetical protein
LPNLRFKPRFSTKADISSRDDPRTNTLGTFNPFFPMGNYFGVLATTGPGPLNFIDIHPRVLTQFPRGVIAQRSVSRMGTDLNAASGKLAFIPPSTA